MYFNDFESFTQAREGAKTFLVEVVFVDGGVLQSSSFPADSLPQLMADIAAVEELKTMFIMWNRSHSSTMSFIPYEHIKIIRVVFAPAK